MSTPDKTSARNGTIGLNDRPQAGFVQNGDISVVDDANFQSLVTTAILAATAFRLKDHEGLSKALRLLVQAVQPFEVKTTEE